MSGVSRSESVLDVRIEPSKKHTCNYDLVRMEKMFRELLFSAGYTEGLFRVKPGKAIHGTSRTAQEGITLGIPFSYALSCEIQTNTNDSRWEALLFPPAGTDVQELARVLRDTKEASRRKSRPSEEVPLNISALVVPDTEEVLLLEEESLEERLKAIRGEQDSLTLSILSLREDKQPLTVRKTEQLDHLADIRANIDRLQEQLAVFQEQAGKAEKTLADTNNYLERKDRQIEERERSIAQLNQEVELINLRILAIHEEMSLLDKARLRNKIIAETRTLLATHNLSAEEQLVFSEELLAAIRATRS